MIEAESLIGFALAFLMASWVGSGILGAGVMLARGRLRSAGPRAERRAAAYGVVLPPILGAAIASVLAGYSVVGPWFGLADHCPQHLHHLHLCLFHGASWAHEAWAVATVAFMGTIVMTRIVHRAGKLFAARVALRRIERVSRRVRSPAGEVLLAPAATPFCFVAGLFSPRIFVSSAAWERLDEEERAAMLAHERAHVDQGDVWRRSALDVFAVLGAPLFAARLMDQWSRATERLCDHRAAAAVGEPETVARALVSLTRAGANRTSALAACFVPTGSDVVERVEALLAGKGDGSPVARRIGVAAVFLVVLVLIGSTTLADPLHHALESLLGAF